jgi:hypothetical protein
MNFPGEVVPYKEGGGGRWFRWLNGVVDGKGVAYVDRGPGVPRIGRQETEFDDDAPEAGAMVLGPVCFTASIVC